MTRYVVDITLEDSEYGYVNYVAAPSASEAEQAAMDLANANDMLVSEVKATEIPRFPDSAAIVNAMN